VPGHPNEILSTGDDGITEITPCTTCVGLDALVNLANAHEAMLAHSATR
jgi:hypothetical protein